MSTENIAEQIDLLASLQDFDKHIFSLKKDIELMPKQLTEHKEKVQRQKDIQKEAEEVLKNLQLKHKDKEGELATKEESIKKLQTQMFQVKTNKEYSALQKEIEGIKADNSLLEENIIRILDEITKAEERITKEKEHVAEEEKKCQQFEGKVNSEISLAKEKLKDLQAQRDNLAPKIDKKILTKYERILEAKEGVAMVPVINDSCGGCNMQLPPQGVNEVRLRNKITFCERCARILYWPQEN